MLAAKKVRYGGENSRVVRYSGEKVRGTYGTAVKAVVVHGTAAKKSWYGQRCRSRAMHEVHGYMTEKLIPPPVSGGADHLPAGEIAWHLAPTESTSVAVCGVYNAGCRFI